jgi:hypothetical protein
MVKAYPSSAAVTHSNSCLCKRREVKEEEKIGIAVFYTTQGGTMHPIRGLPDGRLRISNCLFVFAI